MHAPDCHEDHRNGGTIMTTMADRITNKLGAAFAPRTLQVIDESHQHHGHGGWREGGETHFRVNIVSEAFRGKSRLERHRLVNAALAEELAERVHALAISAKAPDEG
ncbi:BolA family protein [Bosea sp. (in: a-proteobacteria)]|uniref:BolA family protein n=2 Tax=Bosea sp. (in: a-proteobacteria) TaxID=1871050 RepID=UPI0025BBECFB|nr:BolA family protein [Bosea sp. (in: a-proteobacteria)]